MKIPALLILLLGTLTTQARLVTLVLPEWDGITENTNDVTIAANETVEVVAYSAPSGLFRVAFIKNGTRFNFPNPDPVSFPLPRNIIVGPVTVQMSGRGPGYLTVKIEPESFPPDKTIVIPAGGGANIALECSTNLIDWVSAAPGIYTNQPAAKFFRIKAEKVPAP